MAREVIRWLDHPDVADEYTSRTLEAVDGDADGLWAIGEQAIRDGAVSLGLSVLRGLALRGHVRPAFNLAIHLESMGYDDEARRWARRAVRLGDRRGAPLMLGHYAERHRDFAAAGYWYELSTDRAQSCRGIARVLRLVGRGAEADVLLWRHRGLAWGVLFDWILDSEAPVEERARQLARAMVAGAAEVEIVTENFLHLLGVKRKRARRACKTANVGGATDPSRLLAALGTDVDEAVIRAWTDPRTGTVESSPVAQARHDLAAPKCHGEQSEYIQP